MQTTSQITIVVAGHFEKPKPHDVIIRGGLMRGGLMRGGLMCGGLMRGGLTWTTSGSEKGFGPRNESEHGLVELPGPAGTRLV